MRAISVSASSPNFFALSIRVFLPFAAGYFLSYLFRTVNGPIASELIETFRLGPSDLGLLTSLYFLAFAAFQIPVGLLIDRFGPRRVQVTLLAIAACGALLGAVAWDRTTFMLSRALIGLGSSSALVAGIKALSTWLPPQHRAIGNACLVMCGGLGAMASTAPLEILAGMMSWRMIFWALTCACLTVCATVWVLVPEHSSTHAESFRRDAPELLKGLRRVASERSFWRVAPLSASIVGTAFAIHGLWAARWLADVPRFSASQTAFVLLVMGAALTAGAGVFGGLATTLRRRGVETTALFSGAALVFIAIEGSIAFHVPLPPALIFGALAMFGAITVLSFTIVADIFPPDLAGRANGVLNTLHLGTAFAVQAGIGMIIGSFPNLPNGKPPESAYSAAFAAAMFLQGGALLWLRLNPIPRRPPVEKLPDSASDERATDLDEVRATIRANRPYERFTAFVALRRSHSRASRSGSWR